MTFYKKISRDINVNGKKRKDLPLNAEIFSYDEQVAKFVLTLINDIDEIDLSGAEVLAIMEYTVDGVGGSVEAISGIESLNENSIYFIVPEKLRGFEGSVTAGVYVNLSSGEKIDIQNLKFKMSRSLVDSTSGPAADFYFESFDDVLVKVKAAGDKAITDINSEAQRVSAHANQKISEYDAKFAQSDQKMSQLQNSQTALDSKLTETQQKITDADVYTKSESDANVIYQIIGKEKARMDFTLNFDKKVISSNVENPNWSGAAYGINQLPDRSEFKNILSPQSRMDSLKSLDGNNVTVTTVAGSANLYPCLEIKWDVVETLTRFLGESFFADRGAVDVASKANVAKQIINNAIFSNIWGYGTSPTSNDFRIANLVTGTGWQLGSVPPNNSNVVKKLSAINSSGATIQADGNIYTIAYGSQSTADEQASIYVDYATLTFSIEISMNEHIKSMIAAYHRENVQPQITDLAARVLALETKLNQ